MIESCASVDSKSVTEPADIVADFFKGRSFRRYVIAFSGGVDSSALLHIMANLIPREHLLAFHINHGLQDEANDWQQHCQRIAEGMGVRFKAVKLVSKPKPGQSIEAWAREARYYHFEQHLGEGECLISAHHQDDQAETFLLNLMRGCGVDGLASMPESRPLGHGTLLRPMLAVSRHDIELYAEANDLKWVEDPSNRNSKYGRTVVRDRLEAEPQKAKGFYIATARFARARRALETATDDWLARYAARESGWHSASSAQPAGSCTSSSIGTTL